MDEQTQYQFGDAPVSASMSTHRETPEAIIKIADAIWAKVKSSKVSPKDNAGNDALLKELQEENKDFTQSFPVVLRWMVQARQYSRKAFRSFLDEHASKKMDSREDYLRLQAEYLVLLFRESNKRAGLKQLARLRERVIKQLLEDDKRFLAAKEAADKQIVEEKAARATLRREALFLFASRRLAETAKLAAEPIAEPVTEPTAESVAEPTAEPVAEPTAEPTAVPTAEPCAAEPTAEPTAAEPTAAEPTAEPTAKPCAAEAAVEAAVEPTAVEPTAATMAAAGPDLEPLSIRLAVPNVAIAADGTMTAMDYSTCVMKPGMAILAYAT